MRFKTINQSIQARALSMLASSVKQCLDQSNNHRCRLSSVHQSLEQSAQHKRFLSVEVAKVPSGAIHYVLEIGGRKILADVEKAKCSSERKFRELVLANHSRLSYHKRYDIIAYKPGCTNFVAENLLEDEDLNNTNENHRIIVKIDRSSNQ
jgi:hypothetical protein